MQTQHVPHKMNREEKIFMIKALLEDLEQETSGKIHFCDNTTPSTLLEVDMVIKNLLNTTKINLLRKVITEERCIILNGEIDFNEYKNITDKLLEHGFSKKNPIEINKKFYDEYRAGNNLFKIVIEKPKA